MKNYQKQLDDILVALAQQSGSHLNKKPTLLLHACCAPCSSYVIEYLAPYFDITIYYYNPNIYPPEEYSRRLAELRALLPDFPPALQNNVTLVEGVYIPHEYDDAVCVSENPELAREAERGERCRRCYELRMKNAYEYAIAHHFDWFTTTLSISPFKDAEKINNIGKELEASARARVSQYADMPRFLTSDFKKRNGFKRSLALSAEYELYRQDYCGCKYSYANKHVPTKLP
ncbi:MAG: epoxyqueuosine reductase QueH [Treponema sp.]|nr:epoxyqueuosine reductase QueH [Treponema sp.]